MGAKTWIVAAMLLAGCGSSSQAGAPSKYDQTWPTSYSETTCTQWLQDMTQQQKWAAAADMLAGARNKGDGGTGLPDDALVSIFEDGVTRACVIPTANIAEIGAGLYMTERERFSP